MSTKITAGKIEFTVYPTAAYIISRHSTKINPFTAKGPLFDEWNRLALDRVKSVHVNMALAVKGLRESAF